MFVVVILHCRLMQIREIYYRCIYLVWFFIRLLSLSLSFLSNRGAHDIDLFRYLSRYVFVARFFAAFFVFICSRIGLFLI